MLSFQGKRNLYVKSEIPAKKTSSSKKNKFQHEKSNSTQPRRGKVIITMGASPSNERNNN